MTMTQVDSTSPIIRHAPRVGVDESATPAGSDEPASSPPPVGPPAGSDEPASSPPPAGSDKPAGSPEPSPAILTPSLQETVNAGICPQLICQDCVFIIFFVYNSFVIMFIIFFVYNSFVKTVYIYYLFIFNILFYF
jgi:hypothetical protein